MKQTVFYDSNFKDYFKTEEKIKKSLSEIKNIAAKNKDENGNDTGYLKSYEYILECTKLYNDSDEDDAVAKFMLLSTYGGDSSFLEKDQAFVAFYFVCFHYYRQKQVKALRKILNKYVGSGDFRFSIDEYPVIWDLACRYSVLTGDYKRLLTTAILGAKAMNDSPAMGSSFVQAVCNKSKSMYYKSIKTTDRNYPECFSEKQTETKYDTDYSETLIRAYDFALKGIEQNPTYAKYYASVAELLFYTRVYLSKNRKLDEGHKKGFVSAIKKTISAINNIQDDDTENNDLTYEDLALGNVFTRKYVEKFLTCAKCCASNSAEIANYNRFWDMATAFFDKRPDTVFAKKNKIIMSKHFADCLDTVKSNDSSDYITISYARRDYKPVLCDVVELQSRGVQVVFDEHLDETPGDDGETWIQKYEKILKSSKAVICFLSENYISRPSVQIELKMIAEYKKPVIAIDLTGKKKISEIIKSAIFDGETLDSDTLKALINVFDDAKLALPREQNYDAILHFRKLIRLLKKQCGEVFKNVQAKGLMDLNTATPSHPQEDAMLIDSVNNVYAVLDGITRQEGYDGDYSIAKRFTDEFLKIFEQSMASEIKEEEKNFSEILRKVLIKSSESAYDELLKDPIYCDNLSKAQALATKKRKYFEPAGCVGAIAVVENNTLYYGHVGDCGIVLVRDGQVISLTRSQTHYAFEVDKVEGKRGLLYKKYVNKASNKHGYGVINGNSDVASFFNVAEIKLNDGDRIYLMTDGICNYFTENYDKNFDSMSLKDIFEKQRKSSPNLDDRTMIRIKF